MTAPHFQAHYAHWPRRLPHRIEPAQTALPHNLMVSAQRYGAKTALAFLGAEFSYDMVLDKVERVATWLQSVGVAKGDRVILCMQNCPQLVIAHFAVMRANAVVVPVNPMNKAMELAHYITDAQARVVFTTSDLVPEWDKANASVPADERLAHVISTHFTDVFEPQSTGPHALPEAWQSWITARPDVRVSPGLALHQWAAVWTHERAPGPLLVRSTDLAVLPYTSGTTGFPKGCMHMHRSLMHNSQATTYWGNGTHQSVALSAVPMFHITGMVSVMHSTIYMGGTLVIMPRWDRDLAARLIEHHRITHWTNIPTMVIDLLASPRFAQYKLDSLVYIGGGGAAMPQAIAQRLLDMYGLVYAEGYGLTETAAPSHSNPTDAAKQQCLGMPFLSAQCRVVNPQTLESLGVGEVGEILIHGPMVFEGYWRNPEATAAAFVEVDGLRFFRSGDMGRIDEDGYYFITDRLKRMINASGFKVWPAEVEALLFRHPAIQEACIIAARDAYRGETVKAVVVIRSDHEGKVSEQDIIDWSRANMAVYKAPTQVAFVQSLPKSGSGKVMWRHLQEAE